MMTCIIQLHRSRVNTDDCIDNNAYINNRAPVSDIVAGHMLTVLK